MSISKCIVRLKGNCLSRTVKPVVSFSHHHDVLGKRLILDSADRENHFLSRFENATVHNVGRNERNLGTVRAINDSKPLHVNFLHRSSHFVGSPRAKLFSFSISLGPWLGNRLLDSLFFPGSRPLRYRGNESEPSLVRSKRLAFDHQCIRRRSEFDGEHVRSACRSRESGGDFELSPNCLWSVQTLRSRKFSGQPNTGFAVPACSPMEFGRKTRICGRSPRTSSAWTRCLQL